MTDISVEIPRHHGQQGRQKPLPLEERLSRGLRPIDEYLVGAPPVPNYPIDTTGGITDFGMQDNDEWGDCAEAAEVHIEMTTAVAAGSSFVPGPHLALERAQQFAGFGTTPPGPGTNLENYLQGLYAAKIIKAWVPVPLVFETLMSYMAAGFGLYIGVNLFDANMNQFDNHEPLDVVPSAAPDQSEGHCVVLSTSQGPGGPLGIITWSVLAPVTLAWLEACLINNPDGEAYLVVTTEEQAAQFAPSLFEDVAQLGGGEGGSNEPAPEPPAPEPEPEPETFIEKVKEDVEEIVEVVEGIFGRSAADVSKGPGPRY